MDFLQVIKKTLGEFRAPRYRNRRSWYASALTQDRRDLYWQMTDEPVTNPTDMLGKTRMFFGSAIEDALIKNVLQNAHHYGLHFVATQVPIGGAKPNVDGYLDGLYYMKDDDTLKVLEIKVKNGFGADFFLKDFNPGNAYLAQVGYYLYDLSEKGKATDGVLLFILNSNSALGEMVALDVHYDKTTDEVVASRAALLSGETRKIDYRLKMRPLLDALLDLEKLVDAKELPPVDKLYKYPLTEEVLSSMSNSLLQRCYRGHKVHGDWEIVYSRYKDKHIELQCNGQLGYTDHEIQLLKQEAYRRGILKTKP